MRGINLNYRGDFKVKKQGNLIFVKQKNFNAGNFQERESHYFVSVVEGGNCVHLFVFLLVSLFLFTVAWQWGTP